MRDLNAFIKLKDGKNSKFTYKEFVMSEEAARRKIKLEPSEQDWKNIESLVQNVLQPVRDKFGPIRINSGYRSVELSKAIGSSEKSNHNFGFAADIEPYNPKIKLFSVIEFIYTNLKYSELIAEYFPDGWVHVAYNDKKSTTKLKLKDSKHNFKVVTFEYLKELYGDKK